MRVYNKWHFTIKQALKELNLTHPQFVVLASLAYLSEKRGFVERKEHSRDTRAKAVLLNEKGGAILQKAVPLVEEIDEVFFGKLKSDEAQFKHLLSRLHEE